MKKRGQIWVETVIYTLIALTIIGLFLSVAQPKIQEIQDKSIIEQSVEMLEHINKIILSNVQGGVGNQRVIDLGIKKGRLKIDAENDQIIFEIEGRHTYTEPGENGLPGPYVNVRSILASTQKKGNLNIVTLISNYSGIYNITYQEKEELKVIGKAPTPYTLSISNKGEMNGKTMIDITV